MIAPSFTCDAVPEGLLIHYHSARPSLGEYVRGIVTGLASQVYRLNVSVEILEYSQLKNGQSLKHYYKLRVSLIGAGVENDLSSNLKTMCICFFLCTISECKTLLG